MAFRNVLLAIFMTVALDSISKSYGKLTQVCRERPADIVFIIDESSSIWPVHYKHQRDFIANLTERFVVGRDATRIAAITFADKVMPRFTFDDFSTNDEIRDAVLRIDQKTGGTRTDKALTYARHKLFNRAREGVAKIAILITDGASWYPQITEIEAQRLRDHNVTIFAVAISNKINWGEINSIATDPDQGHVFSVESFDDLTEKLVDKLANATCEVQGNPVGVCDVSFQTDMVFVLASATQNPKGAYQAMTMIQSFINDDNTFVGQDSLRIGLVPQLCEMGVGFNLNTYYRKDDIHSHLERKKSTYFTAADHIDYMATQSFTAARGDRKEARNLAVIVVDGKSPNPLKTIMAAKRAKDAGIEIVVVAVGKDIDDYEISQIASEPVASHKITLSDYSEMSSLKHKVYSFICP